MINDDNMKSKITRKKQEMKGVVNTLKDDDVGRLADSYARAAWNYNTYKESAPSGEYRVSLREGILKNIRDCYTVVPKDQMEKRFPEIYSYLESWSRIQWFT